MTATVTLSRYAARRPSSSTRARSPILTIAVMVIGIAVVALVAAYASIAAAACLYVPLYLALVWFRPDLAFFLIFAANPFPYDVGGGPVKMALAEINLVLALPVLVLRRLINGRGLGPNPLLWPIVCPVLAYLAVCLLSCASNGLTIEGVASMGQMAVYLLAAVFVFSVCVDDPRYCFTALAGLLLSTALIACIGLFTRQAYVLGIHKNAVGTNLAYGVIVCAELWFAAVDRRRRWKLALLNCLLAAGLVFTLSRGAWIATIAGVVIVGAMRRQFKAMFCAALLATLLVAVCWQALPSQEREYASDLRASAYNVKARVQSINFALAWFQDSPVVGVGVGLRKQYDATNIVLSTLAETGVLGLAAFICIFLVLYLVIAKTRRRIDPSNPLFTFLVLGAALPACQLVHGCVDHYWSRGLLVAWAPVGMVLYARSAPSHRWRAA